MLTLDPATLLPTGEVVENGLPPAAMARMAEIEMREATSTRSRLAGRTPGREPQRATGGDLDRSRRHSEVRRRAGFGDELRVALVGETATWGALTLLRGADGPGFTAAEVELVGASRARSAEGVRRALSSTRLPAHEHGRRRTRGCSCSRPTTRSRAPTRPPSAGSRSWGDRPAAALLRPSSARSRPRARRAAGDGRRPAAARARVRTPSGAWLVVRGSAPRRGDDEARTAVIVEPARAHELAPLIADAYGLTARERAVTQLVAQGLATTRSRPAAPSPWTVQDHLKTIFEKVGGHPRRARRPPVLRALRAPVDRVRVSYPRVTWVRSRSAGGSHRRSDGS